MTGTELSRTPPAGAALPAAEAMSLPAARGQNTQARVPALMAMRPSALAADLFRTSGVELREHADLLLDVVEDWEQAPARSALKRARVLITGWGCPPLTECLLDAAPDLQAVIHAGGTASAVIDPAAAARRGIALSNAGEVNATPVAEYTFAMILLANKRAAAAEQLYRQRRAYIDREVELRDSGNFGRTVGLVGASRIGRKVARLLTATDLQVLIYDPYLSNAQALALGARRCSLSELMTRSDVVSLHAPVTPETAGMIDQEMLRLLPDGATVINTARGALLDHEALLPHLRSGRLDAVLDVTTPEPLPPEHELWSLSNVTLTPHIAGATGSELARLGEHVVAELSRFRAGLPFAVAEVLGT